MDPVELPLYLLDASACMSEISQRFQAGVNSNSHPFHLMTLSTTDLGGAPDSRLVVLRRFSSKQRKLFFHTDRRSPKLKQLDQDPRVCLTFYDPNDRFQLRIPAWADIHVQDEIAKDAWQELKPFARAMYGTPITPGELLDTEQDWPRELPELAEDSPAFDQFAVVGCQFSEIDLLILERTQHRRVRLDWIAETWKLSRVAP
jgi:pyridoxamine 5'-phosphate oxidase